jgi:hypothetical protein
MDIFSFNFCCVFAYALTQLGVEFYYSLYDRTIDTCTQWNTGELIEIGW